MKRTLIALAIPFALSISTDAFAVSSNTSPGYTPQQIQAPPQFNGGVTTTAPRSAPIISTPTTPMVVPRRR